jgi:hypothetical protein
LPTTQQGSSGSASSIRLRHRHRNASALLAESPHICFREREVYISIAFGTMPHIVRLRRLQRLHCCGQVNCEPASDLRFFIPRHVVLLSGSAL